MTPDHLAQEMLEAIRTTTDKDFEAAWDAMVREGIIDEDGNVLKKIPEPPDWLTGRNGHAPKAGPPVPPPKKARRPRKRA